MQSHPNEKQWNIWNDAEPILGATLRHLGQQKANPSEENERPEITQGQFCDKQSDA